MLAVSGFQTCTRDRLVAREVRVGGQDADDRERLLVERQVPADDKGIGAQTLPPEEVAHHHDVIGAAVHVAIVDHLAKHGPEPEHPEEAGRRDAADDRVGLAARPGDERLGARHARALERPARARPVRDVAGRGAAPVADDGIRLAQDHGPLGIGERQRAQQDGVHHGKDRGGRSDTERDRRHDGHRERRRLRERSQRKPDVVQHGLNHRALLHLRASMAASAARTERCRGTAERGGLGQAAYHAESAANPRLAVLVARAAVRLRNAIVHERTAACERFGAEAERSLVPN